jgi:NAD(P)-dependent dehydrogenase (short-subunit alcohol dehydrogenase family)
MARTYVVTGASSGIGRATALALADRGNRVIAGVRRDGDAAALRTADARVEPVILDVTNPEHVAQLAERTSGLPVAGLVNNAGIAVGGPLEGLPIDAVRGQYEVNVLGTVRVTQAVLPSLRAAKGRIVNIGSIGGRVGTPFLGPYASSKAAVRSLSAALRGELRPWGIWVALVEPGAIDTPIWRKGEEGAPEATAALPEHVQRLYDKQMRALVNTVRKTGRAAIPTDVVVETIEHALTARRPRAVYTVGRDARVQAALHAALPARAFDALVARVMGL